MFIRTSRPSKTTMTSMTMSTHKSFPSHWLATVFEKRRKWYMGGKRCINWHTQAFRKWRDQSSLALRKCLGWKCREPHMQRWVDRTMGPVLCKTSSEVITSTKKPSGNEKDTILKHSCTHGWKMISVNEEWSVSPSTKWQEQRTLVLFSQCEFWPLR